MLSIAITHGMPLRWRHVFLTLITIVVASNAQPQLEEEPRCEGYSGSDGRPLTFREFISPLPSGPISYVVLAGDTIRPNMVFRVSVALFEPREEDEFGEEALELRASIQRDDIEIAHAIQRAFPGSLHNLLLRVSTGGEGTYRLRVEGNYPNTVGGTAFARNTTLFYSPQFLTILIQINKPIFNGGDDVRLRVVLLTMDLKPFNEPVDLYIMDPNGFIMRRWPSRQANTGVASVSYSLPISAKPGLWKVVVDAQGQREEKKFLIEKYWERRFEVFVGMDPFILESDGVISGEVEVASTNDMNVRGVMKIVLKCKPRPDPPCSAKTSDYTIVTSTEYIKFYDPVPFEFPMDTLHACSSGSGSYTGMEVEVEAFVEEYFSRTTSRGYARSRIIRSQMKVQFLSANGAVFKPGMPFETYVFVSYDDHEPLTEEELSSGRNALTLDPVPDVKDQLGDGLYHVIWESPPDRDSIRIRATYTATDGTAVSESIVINRAKTFASDGSAANVGSSSPGQKYLHLSTSTEVANVNEYVVFHVRNNFFNIEKFYYVVMSKNNIIHASVVDVPMGSNVHTFSVAVSSEMTPSFRLLVFHVDSSGMLLSDAVTIPVNSIQLHRITVDLNQRKDYSMDTVEAIFYGESGALVCMSANREVPFRMYAGNDLTKSSVMKTLHSFESFPVSPQVTKRFRSGQPDDVKYYPSSNYGIDTGRTFKYAGLRLMTDRCAITYESEEDARKFDAARKILFEAAFCGSGPTSQASFRNPLFGSQTTPSTPTTPQVTPSDCPVDRRLCHDADRDDRRDITWFRIKRINRYDDIFDTGDDWGWIQLNISPSGDDMVNLPVPKTADKWIFNAFAVSATKGISMIDYFISYESTRPFYIVVEAPAKARSGEQIGIRIVAVNNLDLELYTLITLVGSEDYKFVHVEEDGYVVSYDPRTSGGDHQHLVVVPPQDTMEIHMPIVATVSQGTIEVVVRASTQIRRDEETVEIEIQGEGVKVDDHTSLLLDLKNRANVYEFFDINVDESPVVPYNQWRRYVFGSARGFVAVCGDVVGPAFPELPVNNQALLERPSRSTDHLIYDFAANLWTLKYLRLTNQFDWDVAKEAFEGMNTQYAAIMHRYVQLMPFENEMRGGLKISTLNQYPSVWLTAWAVRHLHEANFPDWENFIYIDPDLISRMVHFILDHQDDYGYFEETAPYIDHPLLPRMGSQKVVLQDGTVRNVSVTLTAHVVISMHHVMESLKSGYLRGKAATARTQAVRFLEHVLTSLRCPNCEFDFITGRMNDRTKSIEPNTYALAITAYALTLVRSPEAESAYKYLDEAKRENSNGLYWSTGEMKANDIKPEFNRPFLQAKKEHKWDSLSVESSSYALMVYLQREGISFLQGKIVRWLNSMRMKTGGFISIMDSIVALEALTEYSFRARLRDITDMTVTLEATGSPGWQKEVHITNESIAKLHRFDLENVWGHINIVGKGRGQAVIQLDYAYGVDYEPLKEKSPIEVFDLDVKETYRTFRNKSIIDVQLCPRYKPIAEMIEEDQYFSGAVTIEVENPSGYMITQREAVINVLRTKTKPSNLIDVEVTDSSVYWYFSKLGKEPECFTYTIRRWFPVANMTKTRSARIFGTYEPEKFYVAMFYPTPLYALDICAVCGSYQCPYCPYYSSSTVLAPTVFFLILPMFFTFIANKVSRQFNL